MKLYIGQRKNGIKVSVIQGTINRSLDPRHDLQNHSPLGFEWGYSGSGPAQLALAILADCIGDTKALKYYQDFQKIVASFHKDGWKISEDEVKSIVVGLDCCDYSSQYER